MLQIETLQHYLSKWQDIMRLRDWDIRLTTVNTEWRKTGDIKIDADDKKAVLMINAANPKSENLEEVVIHELLHLKLWAMDQMLEQLLISVFGDDETDQKHEFAHGQFMTLLESTVEDLTKAFLSTAGENKELSFGRIQQSVDAELRKSEKNNI